MTSGLIKTSSFISWLQAGARRYVANSREYKSSVSMSLMVQQGLVIVQVVVFLLDLRQLGWLIELISLAGLVRLPIH